MNKISLVKKLLLLLSVVFFASCDKEFNTIGSDIVGDDYFDLNMDNLTQISAYDSITGPVQTNNMALNSLGIYNDPRFGVSASHFVTQVQLTENNVTFRTNPEIDSIWVYVPYFSTLKTTDANGIREYELDSVYGDEQPFRLKVYESDYYLGPNQTGSQRFYSDEKSKVESFLYGAVSDTDGTRVHNGQPLNNGPDDENDQFSIDFIQKEKIIYKTDGTGIFVNASGAAIVPQSDISQRVVKERFAPGIWLNLNKDYFKKKIFEASPSDLVNNNVFQSYFKGLYFQAEAISPGQGAMAQLDFSKGFIRITYNTDTETDDDNNPATPTAVRIGESMDLRLSGSTINFFDSNYALPTVDPAQDYRLQLKGGNGSFATIDVFGTIDANDNDIPDDLERIREKNWLINEANLTFYIDQTEEIGMGKPGQIEPNRIYVYDAISKEPILDYYADGSTNSSNVKYNKRFFSGIIEKNSDGKGIKYKIRITEYLKDLLENPEKTNFKLGLVVTENINYFSNGYLKPPTGQEPARVIPVAAIMNPLGTVLYGANIPSTDPNYEKRLKLEIYYTKPD